jgi:septal ring factor EnvC (AmiA/AmiB activator)
LPDPREEAEMDNPKIAKLKKEISNTKKKIADLTAKLREMERKVTILENEEIVTAFRSEKISDAELSELMLSIRKKGSDKKAVRNNEMEDTNFGIESEQ